MEETNRALNCTQYKGCEEFLQKINMEKFKVGAVLINGGMQDGGKSMRKAGSGANIGEKSVREVMETVGNII